MRRIGIEIGIVVLVLAAWVMALPPMMKSKNQHIVDHEQWIHACTKAYVQILHDQLDVYTQAGHGDTLKAQQIRQRLVIYWLNEGNDLEFRHWVEHNMRDSRKKRIMCEYLGMSMIEEEVQKRGSVERSRRPPKYPTTRTGIRADIDAAIQATVHDLF